MATDRERIVSRINELETIIKDSNKEKEKLQNELSTTPGDLLDRDPEEEIRASVVAKNDFLRSQGLLPEEEN